MTNLRGQYVPNFIRIGRVLVEEMTKPFGVFFSVHSVYNVAKEEVVLTVMFAEMTNCMHFRLLQNVVID